MYNLKVLGTKRVKLQHKMKKKINIIKAINLGNTRFNILFNIMWNKDITLNLSI